MKTHAQTAENPYSPWLHRFARLAVGATFLLIVIGGIVTSTESGLAVPDWPTTFGYNMFLYPLSEMVGGVLYEHSHRLMGSLVGLLTVGLFIMVLVKDSRPWLRWLGFLALIGVIVQGVLGGLRVTQLSLFLAMVHACLAQAFFALLCGIAWWTSPGGKDTARDRPSPYGLANASVEERRKLRRLSLITTCLIYVQLIFGAILRHTGNRLDAHLLFAFLVALHIFLLARRMWQAADCNAYQKRTYRASGTLNCPTHARHRGVFCETHRVGRNGVHMAHGSHNDRTCRSRRADAGYQLRVNLENLPAHSRANA